MMSLLHKADCDYGEADNSHMQPSLGHPGGLSCGYCKCVMGSRKEAYESNVTQELVFVVGPQALRESW